MKTANPFNHPFPHAKLDNAQLTSIKRLSKAPRGMFGPWGWRGDALHARRYWTGVLCRV